MKLIIAAVLPPLVNIYLQAWIRSQVIQILSGQILSGQVLGNYWMDCSEI